MPIDETIRAQALDWAVRSNDPAFADWEAFTTWLEEDPAHAQAYDAVSVAVLEAEELIALAGPANDGTAGDAGAVQIGAQGATPNALVSRRGWLGGALAASLALVAGFGLWQSRAPELYSVTTGAGETRSVELEPGTSVALAGDTRVLLDRDNPRFAQLESGVALFTVRHDADEPFEVAVGEERIVDLGTVFDVRQVGADFSVAVSEGLVEVNPEREKVRVAPGQILKRAAGSDSFELRTIDSARVGEWREGRITFEGASMDRVAADLTRATGIAFTANAADRAALVSGSVLVEPIRENPAVLGDLLGLEVTSHEVGWRIGKP